MARSHVKQKVWIARDGQVKREKAHLAREMPFEIQVRAGQEMRTVASTLRTPGNDYELAAGILYAEGYLDGKHDFSHMTYCMDDAARQEYNLLTVSLRANRLPQPPQPDRIVVDGRVCGVSGESVVEATSALWEQRGSVAVPEGPQITPAVLGGLAETVVAAQAPGLGPASEAAALFDPDGNLRELREDVDVTNALNKLVGWGVLAEQLPFHNYLLFTGGRATFTTLQRSVLAGVPLVSTPFPPSSLALSLAYRFGLTLLQVKGEQVRVYTGRERLAHG